MRRPLCRRLLAALGLATVSLAAVRAEASSDPPIQEIKRSFPESLRVEVKNQQVVEFCPDNTCDAFIANRQVPMEDLIDFAFVLPQRRKKGEGSLRLAPPKQKGANKDL